MLLRQNPITIVYTSSHKAQFTLSKKNIYFLWRQKTVNNDPRTKDKAFITVYKRLRNSPLAKKNLKILNIGK